MFTIRDRATGAVLDKANTEREAYTKMSIREGEDVRADAFEPDSYLVKREAIPYAGIPM